MISRLCRYVILLGSMLALHAADTPRAVNLPGVQSDGSVLPPNQWSLRPAGEQAVIAIHLGDARILSRVSIGESFYGLAFSADGSEVFCSGTGKEVTHRFRFKDGHFSDPVDYRLRDEKQGGEYDDD